MAAGGEARLGHTGNAPRAGLLQRIRSMLALLGDGRHRRTPADNLIDNCQQPLLGVNAFGRVVRANPAAAACFGVDGEPALQGREIASLFDGWACLPDHAVLWPAGGPPRKAIECEAQDTALRRLLVRAVPNPDDGGWSLSLSECTQEHLSRQQRDAALSLLNHDLRAPQSATLTLIELWRLRQSTLTEDELLSQVETNALASLSLADDFVRFVRMHDRVLQLQSLDLDDVADEAVDDVWSRARERRIAIRRGPAARSGPRVDGDPEMLQCAMRNILRHALARSPGGAIVDCSVAAGPDGLVFEVTDHGANPAASPSAAGAALDAEAGVPMLPADGDYALAFAILVARRHGGVLRQRRTATQGLAVSLVLPLGARP